MESTDSTVQRKGPVWEERFLRVFAKTGIVSQACKAAKIDRSTAYNRRRDYPDFARAWREAEEDACDALELKALERGEQGSDTLTIFLLKARNPAKFREETLSLTKFIGLFEQMLSILAAEGGESVARRVAERFQREAFGSVSNGHGKAAVDPAGQRE